MGVLPLQALIDSGTTASLIHHNFVRNHNLPSQPIPKPIRLANADNTLNSTGLITRSTTGLMSLTDPVTPQNVHIERHSFYITDIGNEDVILGTDWLRTHNPEVDWTRSELALTRCPPWTPERSTCTRYGGAVRISGTETSTHHQARRQTLDAPVDFDDDSWNQIVTWDDPDSLHIMRILDHKEDPDIFLVTTDCDDETLRTRATKAQIFA